MLVNLLAGSEGSTELSLSIVLIVAIIIVSALIVVVSLVALVLRIKIFVSYWVTNREKRRAVTTAIRLRSPFCSISDITT